MEPLRPQAEAAASPPEAQPAAAQSPAKPAATRSKARRWFGMAVAPLKALTNRPSNDRDWSADVAVLPYAEIDGEEVTVRNVRNYSYKTTKDFTPAYYDKTFRLDDVDSLWFGVEPFGDWMGPAHTFLSFGFKDGTYLAVSIEIRRVKGASFSAWKGLWNNYELTYVVADERDVVRLRSNCRKSDVYLYPTRASKQGIRNLLLDVLRRVNGLKEKPEFYNSIYNTCTTNLWRHVKRVAPGRVLFSYKVLLPAYSDCLAYELGLIDTDLDFEQAQKRFLINERARAHDDDPNFSKEIRDAQP